MAVACSLQVEAPTAAPRYVLHVCALREGSPIHCQVEYKGLIALSSATREPPRLQTTAVGLQGLLSKSVIRSRARSPMKRDVLRVDAGTL
jgi:hypothetical protein